jgi:hypothetical protein
MLFKIIDVEEIDCHLVFCVEHYNADDTFWFLENYRWPGREGNKHKRTTNSQGDILMDNGEVSPTEEDSLGNDMSYLPEGREWAYETAPRVSERLVLSQILSNHNLRLASGWPQGSRDTVSRLPEGKIAQVDRDGCSALLAHLQGLKGREG